MLFVPRSISFNGGYASVPTTGTANVTLTTSLRALPGGTRVLLKNLRPNRLTLNVNSVDVAPHPSYVSNDGAASFSFTARERPSPCRQDEFDGVEAVPWALDGHWGAKPERARIVLQAGANPRLSINLSTGPSMRVGTASTLRARVPSGATVGNGRFRFVLSAFAPIAAGVNGSLPLPAGTFPPPGSAYNDQERPNNTSETTADFTLTSGTVGNVCVRVDVLRLSDGANVAGDNFLVRTTT
ncbi:MAG: hypothetical protein FJ317_03410 [SAR202 cluster bacterium]|nr:hypothetical protein [SAR202 cluster bacterium]